MEEEKNNEESKSNEFNFNLKDVFYALNNNYFGVIKSFVNDNNLDSVLSINKSSESRNRTY